MHNHFDLLDTDVMPIFMIIDLDIFTTMRFSINCSAVICSPTVIHAILREATSENYGHWVYFYHIIFRSIRSKTQKYLATIYLALSYYLYQISVLQVAVKGLTTPLSRWLQGS